MERNNPKYSYRWLTEQRFTDFPFVLEKEFIIAIAIASTCFKVAVNGKHLLIYSFKSTQQQMPRAFTGHHPIFDKLTGFKVVGLQGMKVAVNLVDHILTKDDCEMYEMFSSPKITTENPQ